MNWRDSLKQVAAGRETLQPAPFDAIEIPLVKLWLEPPPSEADEEQEPPDA